MADEMKRSNGNGVIVIAAVVTAAVGILSAIFLPLQGQINSIEKELSKVEERLAVAVSNAEKRSANSEGTLDEKLQIEIREVKELSEAEIHELDRTLQLEIKLQAFRVEALKELTKRSLEANDRRMNTNEAFIDLLKDYHREPTNAEKGASQ